MTSRLTLTMSPHASLLLVAFPAGRREASPCARTPASPGAVTLRFAAFALQMGIGIYWGVKLHGS